jgi:hypothetical protein
MWISCRIRTDSHILTDTAFLKLKLPESNIRVSEVTERDFLLSIRSIEGQDATERTYVPHAHHVIKTFLVAINVATLGIFYWSAEPWVHPVLFMSDDFENKEVRAIALIATSSNTFEELKTIDEFEVQNAVIIFGVLAREKTIDLESEYSKGLLLLRMNFYDINFRREAFLCFYRALENFVAVRILRVRKLKNELFDLQKAIAQLGASQELIDELREIYTTRSSQVAHAQVTPREITFEEVMKAKVFLDFVMHKTFKVQGVEMLEARWQIKANNMTVVIDSGKGLL